jgi:Protein of unknown function (DUF4199)
MKKIVLTFGLISGAMMAVLMFATLPLVDRLSFDTLTVIGYTSMVASFLMVFFGIRSYRENVGGGKISFGKAFQIGILITLISCVCYVIAWQILYYNFLPDFVDKYANYMIEKSRAAGATPEALAAQREQIKTFKALLDNPFTNAALTILEPLPIGLPMTLISAAILRRKEPKQNSSESPVTA